MGLRQIISRVFTANDSEIAESEMPTDPETAREVNPGMQVGRLPIHGAELKGKLVERCPGSNRFTGILEERVNIGACEICHVEFQLTPERKR